MKFICDVCSKQVAYEEKNVSRFRDFGTNYALHNACIVIALRKYREKLYEFNRGIE